jgi:hypothetical protein
MLLMWVWRKRVEMVKAALLLRLVHTCSVLAFDLPQQLHPVVA